MPKRSSQKQSQESRSKKAKVHFFQSEGLPQLALAMDLSPRAYTGRELEPHFLLSQYRIRGSGIVAFMGSCEVQTESLVDWEDRLEKDFIRAAKMIHFIGEFFSFTPREGVLFQRLFMSIVRDELAQRIDSKKTKIIRRGDDLYLFPNSPSLAAEEDCSQWRKLSVSIVAPSVSSQLLHVGLNIDPKGAPVAAIGLQELGLSPEELIKAVFLRVSQEWNGVEWACTKVRAVL